MNGTIDTVCLQDASLKEAGQCRGEGNGLMSRIVIFLGTAAKKGVYVFQARQFCEIGVAALQK